jgi:hypothetical protein
MSELRGIAGSVLRRAERQGYVLAREVRAELAAAGLPEARWKEVVTLAGPSLTCRRGRYYYTSPTSPRLQAEQEQRRAIQLAVQQIIDQHGAGAGDAERRQEGRISFVQAVQVQTEDGREFRLLSRDLSPTGIRLIAARSLLGQKVRVTLPAAEGAEPCVCLARILWTGAIGDGLFENGCTFLQVV